MLYYVYVLQSLKDHRYYIGFTTDVEARLRFHNAGLQRSTRDRIPFRLVLFEEYVTKQEALKREKQIKSWKGGAAFKQLIAGKLPRLGGAPGLGPEGRRYDPEADVKMSCNEIFNVIFLRFTLNIAGDTPIN